MKKASTMHRVAVGAAAVLVAVSLAGLGYAGVTGQAQAAVEQASALGAYAGPVPGSSGTQAASDAASGPDEAPAPQEAPQAEPSDGSAVSDAAAPAGAPAAGTWAASDCGACHAEGQVDAAAPSLASNHLALGVSCVTCHTDEEKLEELHADADPSKKMPRRLKKTDVTPETCTASGCHSDTAALAEATADVTVLTDKDGLTVNPHAVPPTESHEAVTCGNCHGGHSEADPQKVCKRCHHENVYQCGTCHA